MTSSKRAAYMHEYWKEHRPEANTAWQKWHDADPARARKKARQYYLARKGRRKRVRVQASFSTSFRLRVGRKRQ